MPSINGIVSSFMKQKAEARAENAELKKQLSTLGTEVSELKKKIESGVASESASPSKKAKIPRELSVSVFENYCSVCVCVICCFCL